MSANVQESTAVKEGKTYGYQGQVESAPASGGLEQQKQRLMTDIEAFLDSLVGRMGANGAGTDATPAGSSPATTSGTGKPATGAASSTTGQPSSPSSGTYGGGSSGTSSGTYGGGSSGSTTGTTKPSTGASGTSSSGTSSATTSGGAASSTTSGATTTSGKPAYGSGTASTGTEATAADREAMQVFAQREAYRIDVERQAARNAQRNATRTEAAPVTAPAGKISPHQSDSNRAPLKPGREFAPAFGSLGRGVSVTKEAISVPSAAQRPETVPAPGNVATKPIDAYWASYGTAIERAAVRSKADRQTKAMLETIIGPDDRTKIDNTTEYPWRCVCHLLITAQNGTQYLGTGWLVAPRLVLTAGHCVFMSDEGGWAASIEVTPGRNGSDRPFGSVVARDLRSVTGWTQDNNSDCDYGAIMLPADNRLGDQLGWFGYAARNDDYLKSVTLNLSGYPGDGGKTGEDYTQWYMARGVKEVMDRQITYEIDTYGGQSGSPVWETAADGTRYGVGIHTWGTSVSNGATRIVQEVFDNIVSWAGEAP